MKHFITVILIILFATNAFSQANVQLQFNHHIPADSNLTITKWKYYISHIKLISANKSETINEVFLIDKFLDSPVVISVPKAKYMAVQFAVGIDSSTNAKGMQEGALDPMNGMYWTWNTGYINWKVEGRRKKGEKFERITHHLGGFLPPNYAIQYVKIPFDKGVKLKNRKSYTLAINASLEEYLNRSNGVLHVMEPGKNAISLSENIPVIFSFKSLKRN